MKEKGLREAGYFELVLPSVTVGMSALTMDEFPSNDEDAKAWKTKVSQMMRENKECRLNPSCRKIFKEVRAKGLVSCYRCGCSSKGASEQVHEDFNKKVSDLGIFNGVKNDNLDFVVISFNGEGPLILSVGENVFDFLENISQEKTGKSFKNIDRHQKDAVVLAPVKEIKEQAAPKKNLTRIEEQFFSGAGPGNVSVLRKIKVEAHDRAIALEEKENSKSYDWVIVTIEKDRPTGSLMEEAVYGLTIKEINEKAEALFAEWEGCGVGIKVFRSVGGKKSDKPLFVFGIKEGSSSDKAILETKEEKGDEVDKKKLAQTGIATEVMDVKAQIIQEILAVKKADSNNVKVLIVVKVAGEPDVWKFMNEKEAKDFKESLEKVNAQLDKIIATADILPPEVIMEALARIFA